VVSERLARRSDETQSMPPEMVPSARLLARVALVLGALLVLAPLLSGESSTLLGQVGFRILDVLGVEKSHYAGFSMGGWCAFGLMRWFEPRFSSFIVMAAHPFENDMRGMHEGIRTMDQWVPAEIASAAMRERNLANDREALMAACHDGRVDQTAVLKGLSTPCMVIAGDKDEIYEKVKEGALSSDRIEFVTIPGADHIGLLYSCDAVVPHVLRFLGNIK
jgi:pimeloyl-ACP methyl ester carboxylesterase